MMSANHKKDSSRNKILFVAELNRSMQRDELKQALRQYFERKSRQQDHASVAASRVIESVFLSSRNAKYSTDTPAFALIQCKTAKVAQNIVNEHHPKKEDASLQASDNGLFGFVDFAKVTQEMQERKEHNDDCMDEKKAADEYPMKPLSKKQRELFQQELQHRLDILNGWLHHYKAANSGGGSKMPTSLPLLQVNRSHHERLKVWLEKEMNCSEAAATTFTVDNFLHLDKSTSLLLCLSQYGVAAAKLHHKLHSTWYVKPHVQHVISVTNNALVQGNLEQNLVPALLQHVQRELEQSGNETSTIVRLSTFPVNLQQSLLQMLWKELDETNGHSELSFDFGHEHATHLMTVMQLHHGNNNGDDDGNGIYIMGKLERLSMVRNGGKPSPPVQSLSSVIIDKHHHNDWRIALYYLYLDIAKSILPDHVSFHKSLCEQLELKGRIRVSHEGINGVLSGRIDNLQEYERAFQEQIAEMRRQPIRDGAFNTEYITDNATNYPHRLDMKYCHLRTDLSIQEQLFNSLMVKETKTVISLFDAPPQSGKKKQNQNRYQRKRERKRNGNFGQDVNRAIDLESSSTSTSPNPSPQSLRNAVMGEPLKPSTHLSATEWNEKLDQVENSDEALLLDARNCYESRVGHFQHPKTPTLLTNTRKYSDLVSVLASNPHLQDDKRKQVFMYCTGGVRCERISMLVNQLYPEKHVYQLKGGIQTYLRDFSEEQSRDEGTTSEYQSPSMTRQYFVGKNFVFDPRRTDPVHFGQVVGKCLVCGCTHDDYDNGHAPNEGNEARCNGCRMLILICNGCRPNWSCHGEDGNGKPKIFCKVDHCSHEGAAPEPELVQAASAVAKDALICNTNAVNRAYWKLKEAWECFEHHDTVKALQGNRRVIAVDCGAAPGGWTQFLVNEVGCDTVYAIDPATLSGMVKNDENSGKVRHMPMKFEEALPLLVKELCDGKEVPSSPVSIWVCDVNARDESFVIDALLDAAKAGLVGRGTMFVLTIKCAHGHNSATFDLLARQQVERLWGIENLAVGAIRVLHLMSNRTRERTILGFCS